MSSMEKKKLFVVILLFTSVLFPLKVAAQSPSTTTQQLAPLSAKQNARADFKQKLQTIRDARKKTIVEKIDAKIATTNKKTTDKMTLALDKLSAILTKLSQRSAALKAAGKDTAGIESLVTLANSAINTAKTAVAAQVLKQYDITITTEANLKINVGTVVSQFRLDLQAVHKTVVDAKQAVQKAATELARITGKTNDSATNAATTK